MDESIIRTTKRRRMSPQASTSPWPPKREPAITKKEEEEGEVKPKVDEEEVEKEMEKIGTEKEKALGKILPTIKDSKNKVISDENLEKLYIAIWGDSGKRFDSDDSNISEIDSMEDEEIKAKDKKFLETRKYLEELPQTETLLKMMLKMGNETKEEKEERKKMIREMKDELKSKEEKVRDEKKRIEEKEKMDKRMRTIVSTFRWDEVERNKIEEHRPPLIPRLQFARCLAIMVELIPDKKGYGGKYGYMNDINKIDSVKLREIADPRGTLASRFYTAELGAAFYLKKKVLEILRTPEILHVFDNSVFGFDFSTKDCVRALNQCYSKKSPHYNYLSTENSLRIEIKELIDSCITVANSKNPKFMQNMNDNLKIFFS